MSTRSTDPDWPLVRALQEGDENALAELIQKYQQPFFRFICRYVGNEETARDILQETFVRLYFNARKFEPRAKFSTWLYAIAANLCRDYLRSRQRREAYLTTSFEAFPESEPPLERDPSAGPAQPADILAGREQLAALEKAIGELPHKLKSALILFSIEGHSQQECADLLGVSVKTVETRVYRARKILEKNLALTEG